MKTSIRYVILFMISFLMLLPLLWMIMTSLKEPHNVFTQFFPSPVRWENYMDVLTNGSYLHQYWNSIYIAWLATLITILLAAFSGYAFARFHFTGRNLCFLLLLSMLMIPGEVTIIPLFLMMSEIGWVNTHIPLIIIPIFGANGAFAVFVFRQFFLSLPYELEEAARVDGSSKIGTFLRIMLPLSIPAISTVTIFTFLHNWDDFTNPLIFIRSELKMTLPVGLSLFSDEAGTVWHELMSAITMATLPLLLVFFLAQRQFIEGMTAGGVKE